MNTFFVRFFWGVIFSFSLSSIVLAGGLADPKGPVILSVTGQIEHTNFDNRADFDRDMLVDLGMATIKTKTPWHDGPITFQGPTGISFLEKIGVTSGVMKVRALNNYVADVPVSHFLEGGAILAMKVDGKFMRVRDKGPLFIIFPFDDRPELQNDSYYTRSVWQIKSIHVE